jgi:acetyl esterase
MRRMLDTFAGLMNGDLPQVGALVEDVPVTEGVTADVVVPEGEGPHPVLVYLHGGGWICGSPRTHRKLACRFAEAGQLVFNIDYRLAPEHPFPTPFEDCLAAVRWAAREAPRFEGDPARLAVGGDSAGGNLSAAVAAALANEPSRPRAALLLYGVFDFAAMSSIEMPAELDQTPMAAAKDRLIELMVGSYLGRDREHHLHDPRVSPLRAAHRLPPCHVMVGGADPLVSQAEALVAELAQAGVEHEHFVDEGMPHGYAQMEFLPHARPAIDRMVAFLRKHAG